MRTRDSARRAGNNHLLGMRESQAQFKELEDQLVDSVEQVRELTSCMSRINEDHASTMVTLERGLAESQRVTKKLKLQNALGKAHEEDRRLCAQEKVVMLDKKESSATWARE